MLAIRLRRNGSRNAPFYRIVVSDSRRTPRSEVVEELGHYHPHKNPVEIRIDKERTDYWVSCGATLSSTVRSLIRKQPA